MPSPLRLACAAALALAACSGGKPQGKPQRPPPLVSASRVQVRDVPVEIRAPVDVRPISSADVAAKTLGYLDAVLVDRGDKVKKGQLVALVRPSDLPDQLASARSALAQAQAAAALARANKERAEHLAPSGVVSQEQLQQSESAAAGAEAQLASAQSNAAALATRLGETRIESPLDGVVAARRLDPGPLVGPGSGNSVILTVDRIDVVRVFIPVNEDDVEHLAVGQEAHVELDALPGKSFHGKVVRISPAFDPITRTLDAEVQLPNPDTELRVGMYGRGSIVTAIHPNALVVPAAAVIITGGNPFAFTVKDGKAHRVRLELGVDGGNWLEVAKGLTPTDDVVVAGADGLADGMPVRVARDVNPYTGEKQAGAAQQTKD